MNLYAYVGNSPVELVDPLGLQDISPDTAQALGFALQTAIDFGMNQADYYVGMYNRAHELRSQAWQSQSPDMPAEQASYQRHFGVTYQLTIEYGSYNARFAGYVNELQGLGHDLIPPEHLWQALEGDRRWGFSLEDLLVNELAIWAAQSDKCSQRR